MGGRGRVAEKNTTSTLWSYIVHVHKACNIGGKVHVDDNNCSASDTLYITLS